MNYFSQGSIVSSAARWLASGHLTLWSKNVGTTSPRFRIRLSHAHTVAGMLSGDLHDWVDGDPDAAGECASAARRPTRHAEGQHDSSRVRGGHSHRSRHAGPQLLAG